MALAPDRSSAGEHVSPRFEVRSRRIQDAGSGAVRYAGPSEFPKIADALASAFFDTPITIWHVPDESRRLDVMRDFFTALLGTIYLRSGLVYTNVGQVAAGAMWIAPREREGPRPVPGSPVEWCRTCNQPSGHGRGPLTTGTRSDAAAKLDGDMAEIFGDFPRTFELFELFEAHHPQDPHYYLQFIGVSPERQGEGIGSALLRVVLDRCDREGEAAYLEADERSRLLYERHGFESIAELRLPDGPSVFPMWRASR